VFAVPRKSERQLTAESVECCQAYTLYIKCYINSSVHFTSLLLTHCVFISCLYTHAFAVVIWIKLAGIIRQKAVSSVLPDTSVGDVAQSGKDQTVPEVRLDQDLDDPGDPGSVHIGQWNSGLTGVARVFAARCTCRRGIILMFFILVGSVEGVEPPSSQKYFCILSSGNTTF